MSIVYGTTQSLVEYLNSHGTYFENDTEYYEGFELLQPYAFQLSDLKNSPENGCQYLVRLNEKQEIIGVLKWKRYSLPDHLFVPENEKDQTDNYIAIRFIDIHKDYRKRGIAKELALALSQRLDDSPIVGGKATPSGKESNIHRWLENQVSQKYYISEVDLVDEWEEENAVW